MNIKQLLRFSVTICLLLSSVNLLARAGGGHGHSSGGAHLSSSRNLESDHGSNSSAVVVLLLYAAAVGFSGYLGYLAYRHLSAAKSLSSAEAMQKSAANDPLWQQEQLLKIAENTFMQMQKAWVQRDIKPMKHLISDVLSERYKYLLESMQHNKIKNIMNQIQLDRVEIVQIKDYKQDAKDKFTASITGSMIDYKIDERNNQLIDGVDYRSRKFTDLYHFIRIQQNWRLERIESDPNFWDLLFIGGNKVE